MKFMLVLFVFFFMFSSVEAEEVTLVSQPEDTIDTDDISRMGEYERSVFDECRPFLTEKDQREFAEIDASKRVRFLRHNCNLHLIFEQCRFYISEQTEKEFAYQYQEERSRWLKDNCLNTDEIKDAVRAERMVTSKYLQCKSHLTKEDTIAFHDLENSTEKWNWMIHRCPVYNNLLPLPKADKDQKEEPNYGPAQFAMLLNPAFLIGGLIHGLWTFGPEMQFRMNDLGAIDIQLHYADFEKGDKYAVNGFSGEAGIRIAPAKKGLEGVYIALRIGALYLKGKEYQKDTLSDMVTVSNEIQSLDLTISLELGIAWRVKKMLFNLGAGAKLLGVRDVTKKHPEDLTPLISLINISLGPSL